ncbi:MAG: penicillin-binding protein activator LpoB [Elusimicrobiota bacterium]
MKKTGIQSFLITLTFVSFIIAAGCSTRVARLDVIETVDLSGRWNDTDSRLVAEAVIEQCLDSKWHTIFQGKHGKNPVIIVGKISNKTMEHINVETFTKDLEKAMLNSGSIDIVASSDERIEVREERKDIQKWASLDSMKESGRETGADFMLKGVVNSIIDEEKGEKVVFYQADLSLINLSDNSIMWVGQKKIKKFIKRPLFKF